MSISVTQCVSFTDKIAAVRLAAQGVSTGDYGLGGVGATFGAWKKAEENETLLKDTDDLDTILLLGTAFRSLRNACDMASFTASSTTNALNAMNIACAATALDGVVSLDTFATHYNLTTTTKWQCLFAPAFLEVYVDVFGSTPSAHNTYNEVLQSGSSNALGKLLVGTGFLSGSTIDDDKYAGGFGQVKATGITGSGTVTVTGSWRKTDGTTAGGDGTASVTADGTVTLTPPFTDALLLSVSAMSAGTGITAGTIYAEAKRPTGRTNPPV